MAIVTTILPKVIKVHRNTSMGVIFILFFFLTGFFNIMFYGLKKGQQISFPDGNKGKKAN